SHFLIMLCNGDKNIADICDIVIDIEPTIHSILLHLIHIPVVILIILTLFGKDNEDVVWFVFHTAILNLILGISWEIYDYVADENIQNYFIYIWSFFMDFAMNSVLPLAFSRFFYLYFQNQYEKLFTKKTLFWWILCYDLFVSIFLCLYYTSN